jgi:cyclase
MLKKRIIPCLDIKDERTVKGITFTSLRDAGDPVELAGAYAGQNADELVFLDITATLENRKTLAALVEKIASAINIPFTVGGGISTVDDVLRIISSGADKVSVNTSAVKDPVLISRMADKFGSQCVVVAIDAQQVAGEWIVCINGGSTKTSLRVKEWAEKAERMGAGEILLTSVNSDGTKKGFSLGLTDEISNKVNIPVIASGGAGSMEHFREVFTQTSCSAALAASVFHYGEILIPDLKKYLLTNNISVRC